MLHGLCRGCFGSRPIEAFPIEDKMALLKKSDGRRHLFPEKNKSWTGSKINNLPKLLFFPDRPFQSIVRFMK